MFGDVRLKPDVGVRGRRPGRHRLRDHLVEQRDAGGRAGGHRARAAIMVGTNAGASPLSRAERNRLCFRPQVNDRFARDVNRIPHRRRGVDIPNVMAPDYKRAKIQRR